MERSTILRLDGVSKQFPQATSPAVDNITLALADGELLGLLGASGCGKTTLLRMIAGFEQPDRGTISLLDQPIATPTYTTPPESRNVGIVFQDYALFPHLTVAENIAFGLQTAHALGKKSLKPPQARQKIRLLVEETIALVKLEGMGSRYPHQLSGGQQQRVALARSLAPRPRLILLDEPFSNLDVQVRQQLRQDVRHILRQTNTAAILVTHDQEEALLFADRVGIIHQGRLEQVGTPEAVYQYPSSRFVAEFVTQANFLTAQRHGDRWHTELGTFEGKLVADAPMDTGMAMVRQDEATLEPADSSAIVVYDRQFLGRDYGYHLRTASGNTLYIRVPAVNPLAVGTSVNVTVQSPWLFIFPDSAS